jgi:hypothetical protein
LMKAPVAMPVAMCGNAGQVGSSSSSSAATSSVAVVEAVGVIVVVEVVAGVGVVAAEVMGFVGFVRTEGTTRYTHCQTRECITARESPIPTHVLANEKTGSVLHTKVSRLAGAERGPSQCSSYKAYHRVL